MLSHTDLLIRLLLAAALGSAIGFERERQSWAAGLRTHMLVCVGACLIMIVSAYGFADTLNARNVVLDPSRVAAQVVSGIGFLGAGAILMRGEIIRGLTTAASLWSVAAIGLAVGGGLYVAAIAATAIILIILAGIKPIEEKYRDRKQTFELSLQVNRGEMSLETIRQTLGERTRRVKQFIVQQNEQDDFDDVTIIVSRLSTQDIAQFVQQLRNLPFVRHVRESGPSDDCTSSPLSRNDVVCEFAPALRSGPSFVRGGDAMRKHAALQHILCLCTVILVGSTAAHSQSTGCQVVSLSDPPRDVLQCRDGLKIEAEKGTQYRLMPGKSAAPDAVEVSSRAILVDISPARRGGFQVLTPHAIASVRGTIYAVDVQDNQTSVFVARGMVSVTRRDRSSPVILGKGQGVDVVPGQALEVKTWGVQRAAGLLARFGR